MFANWVVMDGLAEDTAFVHALCKWAKVAPSRLAKDAGLTPTTITRAYAGTATTRISTPTLEKLKAAYPKFDWTRHEAEQPDPRNEDQAVLVELLPGFAGMGGGGTGEGDGGTIAFSRSLVETDLRSAPEHLMAVVAEGNSMEPHFYGGDQVLIDRRRTSLAAPGAFCLWDSDGYVIKFLERIQGSDPPKVRIVSSRSDLYPPYERLVEECDIRGRVVWVGRKYQ
jgi:phage repressor protein C with HTH and peptisase S24 domain